MGPESKPQLRLSDKSPKKLLQFGAPLMGAALTISAIGCKNQTEEIIPTSTTTASPEGQYIPPAGPIISESVKCEVQTQPIIDEANSLVTNQLSARFVGEQISQDDVNTLKKHDACVVPNDQLVGDILPNLVIVDPTKRLDLMNDLADNPTVASVEEIHSGSIE